GADSIEDADRLRHGAMPQLFDGIRAPSTLGTFLRSFTHGHALQLHAVHRRFLGALAGHTPLLPGADQVAFIDVDSTHKRVFGPAKQGAQVGRFKGIRTLHPLLATICTPTARPVIAAVRLRQGKSADSRGAKRFVTEALATAVEAGCTGIRVLRADSQFYNADVVAACRRASTHFSITTGNEPVDQAGHRRHTQGRVDADPLSKGGRRSRHRPADLGRGSRRGTCLHRVHRPHEVRAGHRPPDRAAGA
ncbi:transposase, partial [Streptomyces malaysiensis]|uniref:transposase n=1 Tax=Streptomyces malaysiensis TaxID=92644 RepID=UPI003722B24B